MLQFEEPEAQAATGQINLFGIGEENKGRGHDIGHEAKPSLKDTADWA